MQEKLVLAFLWVVPALCGEPVVFDNYFDDTLREVDISEQTAIVGCLEMGQGLATKMTTAYEKCFGSEDYDISDLADKMEEPDRNGDGLPDKYNGNEACFYKEMGWVVGSKAKPEVIKQDMEGLEQGLQKEFEGKVDECAAWNGNWDPVRVKRESLGPSGVERLRTLVGGERVVVRNVREGGRPGPRSGVNGGGGMAGKPGNGGNGGNGRGMGGNGGGMRGRTGNGGNGGAMRPGMGNGGNGGGMGGRQGNGGNGNGNGGGMGGRRGNGGNEGAMRPGMGNGGNGGRRQGNGGNGNGNRGGNGGNRSGGNQLLPESTYNQMWCFDLAMEQVLEKCIAQKLGAN